MAHRTSFYLYKRKKTKRCYWYVCYLDPVTGKQGTAKSIDVLKERLGNMDFRSVTRRDEAVIIAQRAIDRGLIYSVKEKYRYSDYCLQFWDYDRSEYIAMRNHIKPNSIGREYANNMVYALKKHIVPNIPDGLMLHQVSTSLLESLLRALYEKGLASGSVQIIAYSFLLPLKEAERLGLIESNPAKKMMHVCRVEKARGCLTKDEAGKLCDELRARKDSLYPSYYLAILLALITGMRSGEIRALNSSDLEPSGIDGWTKINIVHSIAQYTGLKETKNKYDRAVLIPNSVAKSLLINSNKDGILLPSKQKCGYISAPTLRSELYSLLDNIGIDEAIRVKRNITFHSLRHTFSTLARDWNISRDDRMIVLGHKSTDVNDRYTHESIDALKHVSSLTFSLLTRIENAEKSAEIA